MSQYRLYESPQSFIHESPQSFLHGTAQIQRDAVVTASGYDIPFILTTAYQTCPAGANEIVGDPGDTYSEWAIRDDELGGPAPPVGIPITLTGLTSGRIEVITLSCFNENFTWVSKFPGSIRGDWEHVAAVRSTGRIFYSHFWVNRSVSEPRFIVDEAVTITYSA